MKTRSQARAEKLAADQTEATTETKKEKVEKISGELKKELLAKESPFHWGSANAAKGSKLRPDLVKIVETVFVVDVYETWQRLRDALMVGEKRSDHGTLQLTLDQAERNAYDAHRLFVTAKIERERWERENEVVFGAMWSEANAALQKDKEDGLRSKQITDADVKARVATIHPEDYVAQEVRRAHIKATVESLENLTEQWNSRCRTLQVMLGKLRG